MVDLSMDYGNHFQPRGQERVSNSLSYEMAQVKDSFRRFDVDNSGKLDSKEFRYMCLAMKHVDMYFYVYIYIYEWYDMIICIYIYIYYMYICVLYR